MIKIAHWLKGHVNSHQIYHYDGISEAFREATGCASSWPHHSLDETIEIMVDRGLGGDLSETPSDMLLCFGYEMAEACAFTYANGYEPTTIGRGSRFDQCIAALELEQ